MELPAGTTVTVARKPWWRSKKVWAVLAAVALKLVGARLGFDAQACADSALILLGGAGLEGVVDAASALGAAIGNARGR